jgi:(1->4)-alpha-D-glucan 1-alpha-D-glucosylmutase
MRITATYRLQLHKGFGFRDAQAITDYLADLGVSHAYASPYLTAEPGSTHGYNLVDPKNLNPEIGDEQAFLDWTEALASRGMGHIVDVVPNHMGASMHNAWWADLLENGPSSLYANHFDIEWHPPKAALENKVLLPILGAQYGDVLERGELRIERQGGAFFVRYWERHLPVKPKSMEPLLERAVLALDMPEDDPRRQELESIVTGLRNLPASTETDPDKVHERAREKEVLKRRLGAICEDDAVRAVVDAELERVNGRPGAPSSFDDLDAILVDQCYRLAFWRVATEEINYRRFFDINDLAAVRMEEPAVFEAAHELLLRYVAEGRLQGIRLDHTDGLYDPAEYFTKLRTAMQGASPYDLRGEAPRKRDVYVIAEKILSSGEQLPSSWEIEGTTGYDFLVQASGLFVDRQSEAALTRLYHEVTGDTRPFTEHVHDAKRAIMRASLASEVTMLAQRLERIATHDRRSRDFTRPMLRRAISETIAAFPVYRTYIRPDGSREPTDEQIVHRAIRLAKRRNPELTPTAFDFLRDVLLLSREPTSDEDKEARIQFAMRFQQLTGPVTAKGVEDTAFYTYVRFVGLNEVGGHPHHFGTLPEELHAANAARRESWPRTMTTLGTHDTKRGEDVRARLAVLSEMPERWREWVHELGGLAGRYVAAGDADEDEMPSAVDRYLFLQTVVGAWPMSAEAPGREFTERLVAYAIKAAREAKQRTSWLSHDETYESALAAFVTNVLADPAFVTSVREKVTAIATYGASNGLAATILKIASPGVCDTYQGAESWDLRLVDPDNRGPVDFEALRRLAERATSTSPRELLASFHDGAIKLSVLRAGLRLRRDHERLFIEGSYQPLEAGDEIFAFAREHEGRAVVAALTRQPYRATGGQRPWAIDDVWGDRTVAVPAGRWKDALTGREHQVSDGGLLTARLFGELPVALLVRR